MKLLLYSVVALFVAVFLVSCDTTKPRLTMVGEWESVSILIKVKSMRGVANADSVVNIPDQAAYFKVMGEKPIHTTYKEDGSYSAIYRNGNDSILRVNLGQWKMLNDSTLQLVQIDPKPDTSVFGVQFLQDGAKFLRSYDYDFDGQKDDVFFGIQQKVK